MNDRVSIQRNLPAERTLGFLNRSAILEMFERVQIFIVQPAAWSFLCPCV